MGRFRPRDHGHGFRTADQRDLFQILLGVTGVGPKLALGVLSALEPSGLRSAVAAGDIDALTAVPGVGRRGAQRMLLELRDRLDIVVDEAAVPGSILGEVRAALSGLGYTPAELRGVVEGVALPDASVEDMVRAALKQLGGRERVSVPCAADSATGGTETVTSDGR